MCATEYFAQLWRDYRPTFLKGIKPTVGYWSTSARANRREEVVLSRLRLGHTLLTHKHVIDRMPPPDCDLCHCPLDVPHLVLDCRKFQSARRHLQAACQKANLDMNLPTLLGDQNASIIDALFKYLRDCGLFTRL